MGRTSVERLATRHGGRLAAYVRALTARPHPDCESLISLRDELEPRLRAVVADALDVEPEDLTPDTSLVHDLAADSLDLLDVVVRLEESFDVSFPEREIAAIATFGDLAATAAALVACRRRAEASAGAAQVELRVGSGEVPRFLRVLGTDPYDRELLRDDVRRVDAEPVRVSGVGDPAETASLTRTLLSASLAGAEVRTSAEGRDGERRRGAEPDLRDWPARRLVATSLALVDVLRGERDAALRMLAAGRAGADDATEHRRRTDDRVVTFRAVVATYVDVLEDARAILHAAGRELARLDVVRRAVDERAVDAVETRAAYDSIADALLCYVHALQSAEAWTRTRLPPRGITSRSPIERQGQELRA